MNRETYIEENKIMKDKIKSGIMGLVVGDAFGVPYEFKRRNRCDFIVGEEMVGFGSHNMPIGTWSDDSSLTIATVDSLINNNGKINLYDIMANFHAWYKLDKYTPNDKCFDTGNTIRDAINHYEDLCSIGVYFDITDCGGKMINDNGNGSLMRILPIAFIPHTKEDVFNLSAITHGHQISKSTCLLYVMIAKEIMNGEDKYNAVIKSCKNLKNDYVDELHRIPILNELGVDEIKSSGYVIDTIEAALWSLLKTDNYKDCIITAIKLGGDTDTIAAVAGGLAGLLYGYDNIPKEWLDAIIRKDVIEEMCDEFADVINKKYHL